MKNRRKEKEEILEYKEEEGVYQTLFLDSGWENQLVEERAWHVQIDKSDEVKGERERKKKGEEEETQVRSWNDAGEYADRDWENLSDLKLWLWSKPQRGCYNLQHSLFSFTPDLSDPTKPKKVKRKK